MWLPEIVSKYKKFRGGKSFLFNSEVIAVVTSYFNDLDSSSYNDDIANLEYCRNKCVQQVGVEILLLNMAVFILLLYLIC